MLIQNLYRTPYGDITMRVVPLPGSHTYKLRLRDIMTGATVLRDIVSSTVQADGYVWLDYPVDQSCGDYGVSYPPSYVNWELYVDNVFDQSSGGYATSPGLFRDNTVVKKRIGVIGQSNGEQHFSYLSNGHTHIGNASATTLRNAYADALGIRRVTVQPINLSVGGSGSHAGVAPSYAPHYYWWDIVSDTPGPCYAGFAGDSDATPENAIQSISSRLSDAVDSSVSVKLDALVIAHGEQDAMAGGSAANWRTAWDKVIARLKTDVGNASLPVWYQALGRLYTDMAGTPREMMGANMKAIRDAQIAHALGSSSVRIGAFPAGTVSGTIYDGVHYTTANYHAVASALGAAIANVTSLEGSVPSWATYAAPVVTAAKNASGDIVYTFSGLTNGKPYKWRHTMVVSPGYAIAEAAFTASGTSYSFTWTVAAQAAVYGYPAGGVNVRAWRHESDTDFGANGEFVGAV